MPNETKKKLKNAINENGFFLNMRVNKIESNNYEKEKAEGFGENAISTGVKVPTGENILIFKGLASQNFKEGDKNRNGYKIDPNGWDFNNYKMNPIILLQHNDEYGGIGHALKFEVTDEGLNILFYVDVNTLDEKTRYQVQNGFINAISTGHYTLEDAIEDNSDGKRYTIEDAMEKFGWENIRNALRGNSDLFTYVVTKAESVENSLVTIGSNPKAIATLGNAIEGYVKNKYQGMEEEYKDKYAKNNLESEKEEVVIEAEKELEAQEEEVAPTPVEEEKVVAESEEIVESEEVVAESEEVVSEEEVVQENKKANEDDEEEDEDEEEDDNKKKKDKESLETVEKNDTTQEEEVAEEEEIAEEAVTSAEDNSENEAENAKGNEVTTVEKNSIATNTMEILTEKLETTTNELAVATNKIAELEAELAEKNTLLEQGLEMIEKQNALVERAVNYAKKLGLAFEGTEQEGAKVEKSALERRMKRL